MSFLNEKDVRTKIKSDFKLDKYVNERVALKNRNRHNQSFQGMSGRI